MNKLQQLDKRIRELVPSLQELSFGCHFEYLEEDDGPDHWKVKDVVIQYDIEQIKNGIEIKGKAGTYSFESVNYFEIIGHPIQLQHVLQAILETEVVFGMRTNDNGKLKMMKFGDGFKFPESDCEWDPTKDLNGQSEETISFLLDLLAKETTN